MKIVIRDACIFVDLIRGSMLDAWALLPRESWANDMALDELETAHRTSVDPYIQAGKLHIHRLGPVELVELMAAYSIGSLSLPDRASLQLAKATSSVLLTGDPAVCRVARNEGLTCGNTLWLVEQMVSHGTLTPAVAADKLRRLTTQGRRFTGATYERLLAASLL